MIAGTFLETTNNGLMFKTLVLSRLCAEVAATYVLKLCLEKEICTFEYFVLGSQVSFFRTFMLGSKGSHKIRFTSIYYE